MERRVINKLEAEFTREYDPRAHNTFAHFTPSFRALLKHPDKVKAIHRGYLESGANVITTCSYQLSEEGFEEAGYGRDVARAMARQSVRLAVEARNEFMDARSIRGTERGKKYLVAASLGCYGAYLANG